jgi:hypothetical protein
VFGYPICEEYRGPIIAGCRCRDDGKAHVVQWFERARFECHSGIAPYRHDVLLRRIGVEMAEQLGLLSTEPFQRR